MASSSRALDAAISAYWGERIHDTDLGPAAPGSPELFAAMDAYRYGRLDSLPELIGFDRWRGKRVLDLGCGAGLDVVRFARAGAEVYGVELSSGALALAKRYLAVADQHAVLLQSNAAKLPFRGGSFDLVFCHGVLPFAS